MSEPRPLQTAATPEALNLKDLDRDDLRAAWLGRVDAKPD